MARHTFSMVLALIAGGLAPLAAAQDLPRGQIIDDVQCMGDAVQHYALYVPSGFTPTRRWPVILAFDAGARGRRAVERYQAAAEKYGYIVAASNNSRNGPWDIALAAAKAMSADVDARFPVDPKREYTAGMSGGARVALMVALSPGLLTERLGPGVAGVLASSAGFPPDDFHETVPFPIFGTAGTEDFNHQEMRELDRTLKSPHRLEIFEGGHTWPPIQLATDGVEWMEIQGMKTGLRPRDQRFIDEMYAKRMARAEAERSGLAKMREFKAIAEDLRGLKEVVKPAQRAAELERQPVVKEALNAERVEQERESRATNEVFELLAQVNRSGGVARLRTRVAPLLEQSQALQDSADRRIARRVLASLAASARGVPGQELQDLLDEIRPPAQPDGAR